MEEVKKRASTEGKPIAWIGTFASLLAPYDKLMGQSGHAATAYAIRALQNDTILITTDSETENHKEPAIVDHELHTPNPHYTAPVVVITIPSDGSTTRTNVTVSGRVTDNFSGVATLQAQLDAGSLSNITFDGAGIPGF